MKYHAATILAAAAAALMTTVSASAAVVCSESEFGVSNHSDICRVDSVTPQPGNDFTLPCVEVIFRDNTCHFEANEPNYAKAHEDCHCRGTTFSAWIECQKCLLEHGFHGENDEYWSKILDAASKALCTGTPTAAAVSTLSTPAEAGTVIPTPTSSDGSPVETFKGVNQTAIASQGPWAFNQTAAPAAGAAEPQKTCIDGFDVQQTNTAVPIDPSITIDPTLPFLPTNSFTSTNSLEPIVTTLEWLLPGENPESAPFSDHESSGAVSSSSFGKSGLAVAIAGAIVIGVL
ncbi:uncharacterized protein TrAtP1_003333 [Trichoderma atroviride]|uniref:uncharacterized protein n=1 Tax=Hypocrea atroviridis TaxID=63577 RepID=UPI0033263E1A|nr:hypothetical protein TrAtP1_003333 [Trichoderma atroviride]